MKTAGTFVLTFLVAGLLAQPVSAQTTEYWDVTGSSTGPTDGSGTWNTGNVNWYNPSASSNPVVWDNSTQDTAIFGTSSQTAGYNVVISGTINVGTIVETSGNGGGYSFDNPDYGAPNGTIVGNNGVLTISNNTKNFSSAGLFFDGQNFNESMIDFTSSNGYGVKIINSTMNGGNAVTFNLGTGSDTGVVIAGGGGFNNHTLTVNVKNGWTFSMFEANDLAAANITGFGNTTEPGGQDWYEGALSINSSKAASSPVTNIPIITLNGDALISNGSGAGGAGSSILGNGLSAGASGGTTITGTGNLYLSGGQFRQYATGAQSKTTVQSLIMATVGNTYTGATIITENTMHENSSEEGAGLGYQTVALGVNNALANTELVLGTKQGTAPITGATVPTYTSNGVFDLAGFNQTVTGIATGAGTTASGNYIGNNSGSGNSILTIDGTSATGGFGGTIVDNLGTTGGTVGLAVTGGGSLSLTGVNNTYSGGTSISNGILSVGNTSGSATGAGPVTVSGVSSSVFGTLSGGTPGTAKNKNGGATSSVYNSGGTNYNTGIDSTGYIVGTGVNGVTINSGGHLNPGVVGSVGTITVGDLTLNTGAVLDYEYDGSANDFTAVNGAFTLNGLTTLNFYQIGTTNAVTTTGVYDLFSYGSLGTAFNASNLTVGNAQSGLAYSFVNDTTGGADIIQLDITTAATPEPSTWAMLLLGVGALVWIGRVRASARA